MVTAGVFYATYGHWTLALQQAGFKVAWHFQPNIRTRLEPDKFATKILKANFPNIPCDKWEFLHIPTSPVKIDIIVGSPPCIGFSQGNPKSGPDHWANKNFIKCFEKIAELQPKYFLIEMVPRILKIGLETYYKALSNVKDYNIWDNIFEVSKYSSPVKRKRLYLFGSKEYIEENPLTSFSKSPIILGCKHILEQEKYRQFDIMEPDGKHLLSRWAQSGYLRKGPFNSALQENRVLKPDQPAFTITGMAFTNMKHYRTGKELKGIKPTTYLHRFLAIEEIADLMGFPADYKYCTESIGKKCRIIASGVDVRFTKQLLQHLKVNYIEN